MLLDRGAHRIKFGGYFFHLQFKPEQPDNARGAFTYTGQFTGNAFADFLLGYPTTAVSGIGRGDENGRTSWFHLFAQDDWRIRSNLTVNVGLRYEYNQHMRDVDNRLSSVDFETPGGRLRDRERRQRHHQSRGRAALLPLIPLPYVTSVAGRMGTRPAQPEQGPARAAHGLCALVRPTTARSSAAATASS